jgi:Tol biopolymer transport system component
MFPTWAPDDSRIAFRSDRSGPIGVFVTQGLNSRLASALTPGPLDTPGSWTPDGRELAFGRGFPLGGSSNSDIFVVSVDRPQEARPLLNTASNERYPEFSPDGKWLAYCSDETGQFELYVQPYPGPGRRVTVTSEGAFEPAWSRDSNELFYRTGTRMMSVRFRIADDEFVPEKPVLLFDLPSVGGGADVRSQYDTAPGGRFLMILPLPNQTEERNRRIFPSTLRIVLNWTGEVQRLFSAGSN